MIEKINKAKSWFFEIYKIDNLQARLINRKKKRSLLLLPKMPKGKKATGKKVALAPYVMKQAKKMVNSLFEKRSLNFGIAPNIQPKEDLTCFVKGPHYIQLQRQRNVLCKSLRVPPAINQFTQAFNVPNSYSTT